MGYSCAAAADLVLQALMDKFRHQNSGNVFTTDGGKTCYFYEIGRENQDGAITGSICLMLPNNMMRQVGSFKITASGIIHRFKGIPSKEWRAIEAEGNKRYEARYHAKP